VQDKAYTAREPCTLSAKTMSLQETTLSREAYAMFNFVAYMLTTILGNNKIY